MDIVVVDNEQQRRIEFRNLTRDEYASLREECSSHMFRIENDETILVTAWRNKPEKPSPGQLALSGLDRTA